MRRVLSALVALVTLLAFLAWQLEIPIDGLLSGEPTWWPSGPSGGAKTDAWSPSKGAGVGPEHQPGDPLVLELVEPPATHYGVTQWTEADQAYAGMLEGLHRVQYEPALGHAARELAAFHALEGALPPSGATAFLLNAGGASAWDVSHTMLVGVPDGEAPIRERVRDLLRVRSGSGDVVRVGVGEAYSMGGRFKRHIAVVLCGRGLVLTPLQRRLTVGSTVRLNGTLPEGFVRPKVMVGGAYDQPWEVPVTARGREIQAVFPAGAAPGMIWVEILATGSRGPAPLAQLQLHVGEEIPTVWRGAWPPDEAQLERLSEQEMQARTLLERDRAAFGLPPLVMDEGLTRVARAHSEDMRDGRFFGHLSPRTGGPGDRLVAAGLKVVAYAENVAANDSLWDAQRGLFESLGHRRNMLESSHSHVGLGVAESYEDGRRVFHLTQLFARPWRPVDPVAAERGVVARLADARRAVGSPSLRRQSTLDEVALDHVARRATSPGEVLALAEARGVVRRGAWAGVVEVSDPEVATWPEESLDPSWRRVGVAVWQDVDAATPKGRVILLLAR